MSLADTVVRRLFSMSLRANAAMGSSCPPEVRRHLDLLVKDLDETIRFVRNAIFEAGGPGGQPSGA